MTLERLLPHTVHWYEPIQSPPPGLVRAPGNSATAGATPGRLTTSILEHALTIDTRVFLALQENHSGSGFSSWGVL